MRRMLLVLLMMIGAITSLTGILFFPPLQAGEELLSIEIISEIPLDLIDIVTKQGKYLYILDRENNLRIFDLNNPISPQLTGTLPDVPGITMDVSGDYAYTSLGNDGIGIFDVSDPTDPKFATTYYGFEWHNGLPPHTRYLKVAGEKLLVKVAYYEHFLDCVYSPINVLDVSNPTNPVHIGVINSHYYHPMAKYDDYIIDNLFSKLSVYNTHAPGIPPVVGSVIFWDYLDDPYVSLVARNGYVILRFTQDHQCYFVEDESWHIVDLSKPSDPQIILSELDDDHGPRHAADGYVYIQRPAGLEVRDFPDFAVNSLLADFGVGFLENHEGFFLGTQFRVQEGDYLLTFRISAVSEIVDPAVSTTLSYSHTLGLTSFTIMTNTVLSPTVVSVLPLPAADRAPLHSTQIQAFDIRGHRPDELTVLETFQKPITVTLPINPPPPNPDTTWEFLYWTGTHWMDALTTCAGFPGMAEFSLEFPGISENTQVPVCLPGKYGVFELKVFNFDVYLPAGYYR